MAIGYSLESLARLKQDKNVNLNALSGLSGSANLLPYFTGAGVMSATAFTEFARSLLGKNSAAGVNTLLGLGTAATKNVGTAPGQIPDMGSFIGANGSSGYRYLPGGTLIQWGTVNITSAPSGTHTGTYPVAFPTSPRQIFLTHDNPATNILAYGSADMTSKTQFRVNAVAIDYDQFRVAQAIGLVMRWFCIGD